MSANGQERSAVDRSRSGLKQSKLRANRLFDRFAVPADHVIRVPKPFNIHIEEELYLIRYKITT